MPIERVASGHHATSSSLRPALPALGALACVVAGLLVARWLWQSEIATPKWLWLGVAAAGALVVATGWVGAQGRASRRGVGLALVLVSLSAGWWQHRVAAPGASGLARALPAWPEPTMLTRVEGVVVERGRDLRPTGAMAGFMPFGGARHLSTIRVERVGERTIHGDRRLTLVVGDGGEGDVLKPGERVSALGYARGLSPPMNPGERDARPSALEQGVVGTLRAESWRVVDRAGPSDRLRDRVRAWRDRARARARAVLPADGPGAALLGEVLLGARDRGSHADDATRDAFRRVGLAHLLAISGFHLVVLAGMVSALARATPGVSRFAPWLVVLVVLSYMALLPARPPVLRAGAMLVAWYGVRGAGRRQHALVVLAWVAIGLLAWRPSQLWDAGFQLSLLMTAALVTLTDRAHARLWGPRGLRRMLRGARAHESEPLARAVALSTLERVRMIVTVSALCWSIALPITAHWFGQLSPLAVLATLLVTPMLVPVLWAGYVLIAVGLVWPGGASWASEALGWFGGAIAQATRSIDAAPIASVRTPTLSAAWACAGALAIAWWWSSRRVRVWWAWAPIAIAILWAGVEAQARGRLSPSVRLRMDTLAVGDGTCHLLRARGG
ncbi:MAG: ComEC/Rec2 family competence protein, partial [Planctomycetota bacterium]